MIQNRSISMPMSEQSPFQRMCTLRECAAVKRYHTERVAGDTVAIHSYGVVLILLEICKPRVDLLRAALYHDLSERETGDTPFFAKRLNPALRNALKESEKLVEAELHIEVFLTEDEQRLLKIADLLEMIFHAFEERSLGNLNAEMIYENLNDGLRQYQPLPEKAQTMWFGLIYAWNNLFNKQLPQFMQDRKLP